MLIAKGDLFAPKEQRAGNKRQRQEIEDGGQGVLSQRDKGLPLDREETDMT